jgi:tRNA U34 5-methylaminomethyl-2-thiouridine-forming methyltransferase MnmC
MDGFSGGLAGVGATMAPEMWRQELGQLLVSRLTGDVD